MKPFVSVSMLLLGPVMVFAQQSSEPASAKPAAIQGSGCVIKAVETGCLVLKDTKTGELYNLLFTDHGPAADTAIRFKATEHQGMTTCMQGKAVNVTAWKRAKDRKCPPAPSETTH